MLSVIVQDNTPKTEEVEITPDFCFQKAAESLLHPSFHINSTGADVTIAAEWRQLGVALRG